MHAFLFSRYLFAMIIRRNRGIRILGENESRCFVCNEIYKSARPQICNINSRLARESPVISFIRSLHPIFQGRNFCATANENLQGHKFISNNGILLKITFHPSIRILFLNSVHRTGHPVKNCTTLCFLVNWLVKLVLKYPWSPLNVKKYTE